MTRCYFMVFALLLDNSLGWWSNTYLERANSMWIQIVSCVSRLYLWMDNLRWRKSVSRWSSCSSLFYHGLEEEVVNIIDIMDNARTRKIMQTTDIMPSEYFFSWHISILSIKTTRNKALRLPSVVAVNDYEMNLVVTVNNHWP